MITQTSSEIIAESRALVRNGRLQDAFRKIKSAVGAQPNDVALLLEFATIYRLSGLLDRAEQTCRRILELEPNAVAAFNNLGVIRGDLGDAVGADKWFAEAMARAPGKPALASNRLANAQYIPGITAAALLPLHQDWDERFCKPWVARWPKHPARDPAKKLKIGFLSGDFARHPIGFFVLPLFRSIDRTQCEVHGFAASNRHDEFTAAFIEHADGWHHIADLSDDDAAARIGALGIDILFDLAGHTHNGRLGVFIRKPAPIQISWAGYVGTTGLSAIDYVLADGQQAPPEDDRYFTERVLRMPACYVPYDAPRDAPDVAPPPANTNGFVTFGGMHNPVKVNDDVLRLWAEVLRRVPGSRLRLQFRGLDAPSNIARVHEIFAAAGVGKERAQIFGFAPPRDLLAAYGGIDIAVDSTPYTGGLTTCEALWMGVPVVTLRGATFAGRHAASYLTAVGLPDLITTCRDEYIDRAVSLAADLDRLTGLRAGLRNRMRASPLLNHTQFAADFLAAMRKVWAGES